MKIRMLSVKYNANINYSSITWSGLVDEESVQYMVGMYSTLLVVSNFGSTKIPGTVQYIHPIFAMNQLTTLQLFTHSYLYMPNILPHTGETSSIVNSFFLNNKKFEEKLANG